MNLTIAHAHRECVRVVSRDHRAIVAAIDLSPYGGRRVSVDNTAADLDARHIAWSLLREPSGTQSINQSISLYLTLKLSLSREHP